MLKCLNYCLLTKFILYYYTLWFSHLKFKYLIFTIFLLFSPPKFRIIKNLFQNIGFIIVLNLLVKPLWLLTDFKVQDRISHEEYGIYAALFSLGFLFVNISDLGINVFAAKKLASDKTGLNTFFSNTFAVKLCLCILYPLMMVGVGFLLGYRGDKIYYLLILSFAQALLQTIYFFRSNFQANQHFATDAFASVADKVFLIIVVVFLLSREITLSSFIYSVLLSSAITFFIFYIVILKNYGWIKPAIDFPYLKGVLKLSLPFALIGILYAVNERVDMVMLERLGGVNGQKYAGLYAGAYRWLDAFMMYLWTVLPIFFAKFAHHHKNPSEQRKLIETGKILCAIPMIFVGVFIFFYGEKLFWLFENSSSEEIATMTQILKVLFISAIFQGMFAVYGTYLNATGHEKQVSKMVMVSILINIILNFIFIPQYGPIASAFATLFSSIFISILYIVYISKRKIIAIPGATTIKLSVTILILLLVFYTLNLLPMAWYVNTIIAGIFLLIFTYMVNTGNIRSILKKK
ncbi:MAG: polysaccharide biosynthesis C-terminal domain-containing protein [Cytophagaceae bacterium]|nr:polysaccharide biosynthesis C-terminal domain-containing protein [Cytophagaceae bacterium]